MYAQKLLSLLASSIVPARSWMGQEPSGRCVRRLHSNAARAGSSSPAAVSAIARLDVVPRIGVATLKPGDGAGGFLRGGDRQRGLPALLRGKDTRNRRWAKSTQLNIHGRLGSAPPRGLRNTSLRSCRRAD